MDGIQWTPALLFKLHNSMIEMGVYQCTLTVFEDEGMIGYEYTFIDKDEFQFHRCGDMPTNFIVPDLVEEQAKFDDEIEEDKRLGR
jgi:hypothetical protein